MTSILQRSTVVANTSRTDRGDIRRSQDSTAHPELGLKGCQTMYEAFRHGCAVNPLGPCMGFRAVSTSGFATPFIYSSYSECLARVNAFAAGLETLNLVEPNDENMICCGLYMKNCMEWVLAEHAIFALGGTTVPFYDTLGPDTVQFILNQTRAKSVVCSRAELSKLAKAKRSGECPRLYAAILVDGVTPDAAKLAAAAGLEVFSYAKVEAAGAERITVRGHKHSPPDSDTIATFCYTSGTTGDPKGALLSHGNLVATIAGIQRAYDEFAIQMFDRHLSYLPLAHIFERLVMAQMLIAGASVAFFRGDPLLLIEDLQACRPTFMPAAPRVLNKICDKITNGIRAAGGLKKTIFDAGLAAKTQGLKHGHLKHGLYDRLLFNKIKKALGMDQLRIMVSGSAPLSQNVMIFFRCMLGVPVIEGYGQTEGSGCTSLAPPDDMATIGHVGGPHAGAEIVLMNVPEMGYVSTDTDHRGQACFGRGEICVRGPGIFKGYYKDEEKTRETIDEEGWLHSGDIGLWRPDGTLQIIDRKKNIFKLSQGEYVAPEKIENVLQGSPLIAQCFVYGDSFQSVLVAVIVPDEEPVRIWAATHDASLAKEPFEQICKHPILKKTILSDIRAFSEQNKLNGFETVKAIYVDSSPFSLENDLMTPTFKLKRQKARDHYEAEIAKMYAGLPAPFSKL